MASQLITVATIGGVAAARCNNLVEAWSNARQTDSPNAWSADQWPESIRQEADRFADQLRAHATQPPVIYFAEWADLWSMGDLFHRWLSLRDGPLPLTVHANRHQIFAYRLPDGGRLVQHFEAAGPQQFRETNWFLDRVIEAIETWDNGTEDRAIIVLRHSIQGSVLDDEIKASLGIMPSWLDRNPIQEDL
jgi:hypothetical protein